MSRIGGVVVGKVKDVKDPEGEGRIQIEFPWMAGKNDGYWAPAATLMAGGKRGSWFMPEEGDEVLVAFDHGDVNHPFIVGFLWNGADKPPVEDEAIDEHVRRLRTVKGHTLDFDDRDGKEKVVLTTKGKHVLELVDAPGPTHVSVKTTGEQKLELSDGPGKIHAETQGGQKVQLDDAPAKIHLETTGGQKVTLEDATPKVHIQTAGGQKVTLDDAPMKVELQTTAGQKVTLQDAPPTVSISLVTGSKIEIGPSGITVSAPAGMLTVNCLQATISASAMLSISAPFTSFSGIVQIPTLIANAVVSSAYTPAPGNTMGL
jgi:uncharacterized protein involved in type VI secretion and phage assembly